MSIKKVGRTMERALIIRQPWLNLILDGKKTWEMRSRPTKVRGKIGLIEQGTGLIVGEAYLDDCPFSLLEDTPERFNQNLYKYAHQIDDLEMLKKWHYPWVLRGVKRYKKALKYKHPQGAVTWVKLENN